MSDTSQVVCGHCGQINRLPASRASAAAKCGKCHVPIFSGHPIEVDEAAFKRHLAHSDLPLLVDVWAPWCGPCRAMAPMFERATAELEPRVRALKLNSDIAPDVSARFAISGIPTLLLLKSGQELSRISGAMDSQRIVAWTLSGLGRL